LIGLDPSAILGIERIRFTFGKTDGLVGHKPQKSLC
jgi:hypothetical protein